MLGCSPPIVPAAIQSSIRCSIAGIAARLPRTFSSVASLKWAEAATIGPAVFNANPIGIPSFAPSE